MENTGSTSSGSSGASSASSSSSGSSGTPTHYDAVVLGTGVTQSLLAA